MLNSIQNVYGSGQTSANLQSVAGGQAPVVNSAELKSLGALKTEDKSAVPVSKTELDAAVKKLNDFVAPALQSVQFSVVGESHRVIVKVVDTQTNEVLRQIPNEEVLAISKSLDSLKGLLIKQTA